MITKPIPNNPNVFEEVLKIAGDMAKNGADDGTNPCLEQPPAGPIVVPEEVCWRCQGRGSVQFSETEKTPCGACLGTGENPKPCPQCRSRRVKIATDSGFYVCWHCRDCGFCGPYSPNSDAEALRMWEALPR